MASMFNQFLDLRIAIYFLSACLISDNDDPIDVSYRTKVLDIYPPCPANFDPAATKEVSKMVHFPKKHQICS